MAEKPDFHNKKKRLALKLKKLRNNDTDSFKEPKIPRKRSPAKKDREPIILIGIGCLLIAAYLNRYSKQTEKCIN